MQITGQRVDVVESLLALTIRLAMERGTKIPGYMVERALARQLPPDAASLVVAAFLGLVAPVPKPGRYVVKLSVEPCLLNLSRAFVEVATFTRRSLSVGGGLTLTIRGQRAGAGSDCFTLWLEGSPAGTTAVALVRLGAEIEGVCMLFAGDEPCEATMTPEGLYRLIVADGPLLGTSWDIRFTLVEQHHPWDSRLEDWISHPTPGDRGASVYMHAGPLRAMRLDHAETVQREGFTPGLAISGRILEQTLCEDLVFGAVDFALPEPELAAMIHVRVVPAHQSIGANAILGDLVESGASGLISETAPRGAVVCHSAATRERYRNCHIAQRMITEVVMPYVEAEPRLRGLVWRTSSPVTYFVDAGRKMVESSEFGDLVSVCDDAVRANRPAGHASLASICEPAAGFFKEQTGWDGFAASKSEAAFFADFYAVSPTHSQLTGARSEKHRIESHRRRLADLFGALDRGPTSPREAIAAFCVCFLAVAMTQMGVYRANDGKPVDRITSFHRGNGADLDYVIGPLVRSRMDDIAAWGFGQSFIYDASRNDRQRLFERQCSERRDFCRRNKRTTAVLDVENARVRMPLAVRKLSALLRSLVG